MPLGQFPHFFGFDGDGKVAAGLEGIGSSRLDGFILGDFDGDGFGVVPFGKWFKFNVLRTDGDLGQGSAAILPGLADQAPLRIDRKHIGGFDFDDNRPGRRRGRRDFVFGLNICKFILSNGL